MPTYACYALRGLLTEERRSALAERFATSHGRETGAPRSFVQSLFMELDEGARFIGGRRADLRGVFVHGHIRDGRTVEVRERLALSLRDDVVAVTGTPGDLVWVYLSEIPAGQMIEFGRPLPPTGREAEWMAELPSDLRDHLSRLDSQPGGAV
jgi:phenylpyruvate tautomerase PptA (4-oxalocrotonate tautomerase family)